jgi:hypothetical protein
MLSPLIIVASTVAAYEVFKIVIPDDPKVSRALRALMRVDPALVIDIRGVNSPSYPI